MAKAKKKKNRKVSEGIAYINASFNNTLITITDNAGNKLCQNSSGACGFRGARKSTPFAAQQACEMLAKKVMESYEMKRLSIVVKGPGQGRESSIRALRNAGLDIIRLTDATSIPHNGCRPRKKRRV
mgnify:CR=1 FL=1